MDVHSEVVYAASSPFSKNIADRSGHPNGNVPKVLAAKDYSESRASHMFEMSAFRRHMRGKDLSVLPNNSMTSIVFFA